MTETVRRMAWSAGRPTEPLLTREWLVTNGLGGYASGTVGGVCTRRYHGLLISAFTAPLGRTVMVSHLSERVRLPDGTTVWLGGREAASGALELPGATHLEEFRLESGLPVWRYRHHDYVLEKRVRMLHLQNTTHVTYRLVAGRGPVRLKLHPAVHFRGHEDPVSTTIELPYVFTATDGHYEISGPARYPPLRLRLHGEHPAFTVESRKTETLLYRIEESRGYQARGELWAPGYFRVDLEEGKDATLVLSTERWDTIEALTPDQAEAAERERRRSLLYQAPAAAQTGPAAEMVLAADQFIITPEGRKQDAARAQAAGDEVRTVIAGYHWFTDWGRDTMISLEGLTLATGRKLEAGYILRTFAHYVKDGLIPNMFPEGNCDGLYHTADATLWFFHAVQRYLEVTRDRPTLEKLLPTFEDIVAQHVAGTKFGIGVDPKDGLLKQGAEGYQLTWMDAKVDGWVVTPRRGKAVEINGLWFNALKLLEGWEREVKGAGAAQQYAELAERARRSFNRRFWFKEGGYLYDVIDGEGGDDPALRPNQLLSFSLEHPVLERDKWEPVLAVAERKLLTPVGLRSLAPGQPDYKPRYYGDLRTRDAAYHQGTVWAWLIGPYIDCWLKVHPDDKAGARRLLMGLVDHHNEACIGSMSEIFDAEEPFTPRGCIAQAWSVAEALRCWLKTA